MKDLLKAEVAKNFPQALCLWSLLDTFTYTKDLHQHNTRRSNFNDLLVKEVAKVT